MLLSALGREDSFAVVVVKAGIHNWSKCWKSVIVSVQPYVGQMSPLPDSRNIWEEQAEKMQEPEDRGGEPSVRWELAGAGISLQKVWLSAQDVYKTSQPKFQP